jgi:hypothetical protein
MPAASESCHEILGVGYRDIVSRSEMKTTLPVQTSVMLIERRIFLIRGARVMLDADLAALYGVPTKVLNQAV